MDIRGSLTATAVGYYRDVVKGVLARLVAEGVLEADRRRRPGFDARIVRISKDFVARDESKPYCGLRRPYGLSLQIVCATNFNNYRRERKHTYGSAAYFQSLCC